MSATVNAAQAIKAGDLGVGIACGVESMSRSGWAYMKAMRRSRRGSRCVRARRGRELVVRRIETAGRNAYIGTIETAQNVSNRVWAYAGGDPRVCAAVAADAKAARDSGRLAKQIMPCRFRRRRRRWRACSSITSRSAMRLQRAVAALRLQSGTTQMTAANSTPLTDGASAMALASGERAAELGVEPCRALCRRRYMGLIR